MQEITHANARASATPVVFRILVIEDDEEQAGHLLRILREAGHDVQHSENGRTGLFMAISEPYDALIVDRRLPNMDGLQVISALRAAGNLTPTIVLSGMDQVHDRVQGLRAGGDDYLGKPFAAAELIARLDAVIRRKKVMPESVCLRIDDLELNRLTRDVRRGSLLLDLKPKEFSLLEYMMLNSGEVISRTMLFEAVWNYHFDPQTNVIDVHMSRLRAKIDLPGHKALIRTLRGSGYCLKAEDA